MKEFSGSFRIQTKSAFRALLAGVVLLTSTMIMVSAAFAGIAGPISATGQSPAMRFEKVELRTSFGSATEGTKGRLEVSDDQIRFTHKDGREYFTIASDSVTGLFYSRVSGRRIKTAIVVTPLLLFTKGKKHYMTISFDNGNGMVGALEFRLDKKNYRGVLRAVESVSGIAMEFDQEGIKDEKETIAARNVRTAPGSGPTGETSPVNPKLARLEISSVPDGAELEIDGAFAGTVPRLKDLEPGEYTIKIKHKGYKDWERKLRVSAGERIPIKAELEKDE